MPALNRVILDTSALLALVDSDDEFHEHASETYDRLLEEGWELWVTSYIRVETTALVHRRLGFEPLHALVESLDAGARTVWMDESLHAAAWAELLARQGRRLSFVDCSTLVSARALGASVFAFDSDFSLEGIPVVP